MKGSLWKFTYLFCATAGILAGYGISALIDGKENKPNITTKDNTLVREAGDGVFFDEIEEKTNQTGIPAQLSVPSATPYLTQTPVLPKPTMPQPTKVVPPPEAEQKPAVPTVTDVPVLTEDITNPPEDRLPSLGLQWGATGEDVPKLQVPTVVPPAEEPPVTQTITYPAQIFGQVPVLNRSDAYVSYFEFAYDLIAIVEPVVSARGMNINVLLAQFVIKALFCGVDVEKLDINAPIPRRLAALCLWIGAQVLNESGSDTSDKSAGAYVTDISGCSAAEKKAVAYLYESGILKGYQVSGQRFCPQEGLKTEAGKQWLTNVKQRWK